jgi:hypothetical protein
VNDIAIDSYLRTYRSTQSDNAFIDDAVINLHPFTPTAQNFGFEESIQMLRHIGLGGIDFLQQLPHIFFFFAQAIDDL